MVYRATVPVDEVEIIQQLIKECLDLPEWQQSNYLKLMHGRLEKVAKDLQEAIDEASGRSDDNTTPTAREHPDEQLIYISIYSAFGRSIEAWDRVVINLPKQYVSRSVYLNEKDAQYAARFKGLPQNEAYIAVWVKKTDIINTAALKDKFDRALITLKDRAIRLENIEYVWSSSILFKWQNNHLVRDKEVPDLSSDDEIFS